MAAIKTDIRKAVVAALVGKTVALTRVYDGRRDPVQENNDNFPALFVYSPEESVSSATNTKYERVLSVNITGLIAEVEGINFDEKMDELAEEIEQALNEQNFTIQRTVKGCVEFAYSQMTSDVATPEGLTEIYGSVTLQYSAVYSTNRRK